MYFNWDKNGDTKPGRFVGQALVLKTRFVPVEREFSGLQAAKLKKNKSKTSTKVHFTIHRDRDFAQICCVKSAAK